MIYILQFFGCYWSYLDKDRFFYFVCIFDILNFVQVVYIGVYFIGFQGEIYFKFFVFFWSFSSGVLNNLIIWKLER